MVRRIKVRLKRSRGSVSNPRRANLGVLPRTDVPTRYRPRSALLCAFAQDMFLLLYDNLWSELERHGRIGRQAVWSWGVFV